MAPVAGPTKTRSRAQGINTHADDLLQGTPAASSLELTSNELWAIERSLPTAKSQREKKLFELARRLLALEFLTLQTGRAALRPSSSPGGNPQLRLFPRKNVRYPSTASYAHVTR